MQLNLKGPDGFGFLYDYSGPQRVDIMPPNGASLGMESDPMKYIGYIDGEEIGRFDDLPATVTTIKRRLS